MHRGSVPVVMPASAVQMAPDAAAFDDDGTCAGRLTLRNIVPAPFLAPRIQAADALVLFSATLNPPTITRPAGPACRHAAAGHSTPFRPGVAGGARKHQVHVASGLRGLLAPLAQAMGAQYQRLGNHIAFFSSFDYM
ncbi:MAG: hypothetical protein U1E71_06670 [Ramlibacter sp.]